MVDRDFIRAVIQEAAKGRRSRKDIAPVLADLDGYVEKTYELVATESFVPSEPKIREIYDESSEKHRKIKMVPFWPKAADRHWDRSMDACDGYEAGAYARYAPVVLRVHSGTRREAYPQEDPQRASQRPEGNEVRRGAGCRTVLPQHLR